MPCAGGERFVEFFARSDLDFDWSVRGKLRLADTLQRGRTPPAAVM